MSEAKRTTQEFNAVVDDGSRQQFPTGSQRSSSTGEGRFDLLPFYALSKLAHTAAPLSSTKKTELFDLAFKHISYFAQRIGESDIALTFAAWAIMWLIEKEAPHDFPTADPLASFSTAMRSPDYSTLPFYALTRLAKHYENGAVKYGDHNWRLGQPFSRYISSALRHLCKYAQGWTDEDHLSAAAWNVLAILETRYAMNTKEIPNTLDDRYAPPVKPEPVKFKIPDDLINSWATEWGRAIWKGGTFKSTLPYTDPTIGG